MKKLNSIFKLPTGFIRRSLSVGGLLFSLLFSNSLKAQDDPNCGVVIDGVLADSIISWSFGNLNFVVPFKQSWKKYDLLQLEIYYTGADPAYDNYPSGLFLIKPANMEELSDAKYLTYTLLKNEDDRYKKAYSYYAFCKGCGEINTDLSPDPNKNVKKEIYMAVRGHKITGVVSAEVGNGNVVKTPIYNGDVQAPLDEVFLQKALVKTGELLYETKHIPYRLCFCDYDKSTLKKLVKESSKIQDKTGNWDHQADHYACEKCKLDLSKRIIQPGQKFPFTIEKVDYEGKFGKVKK